MEERRRRGISWIGERVAVAVSVMGFGSVVESYSCANPISGLLRVYFSHTRRADRGIERGSLSRASRSPRDRYRSLFLAINDRPACPVYFIRASLSLSLSFSPRSKPKQTIFADISRYLVLENTVERSRPSSATIYLPTYLHLPSIALFIFFAAAYFSSIYSDEDADRGGQRDDGRLVEGVPKGIRPFICVLPAG